MRYYLGPWVQRSDDTGDYWGAPDGTVGLVDLRSLPGHNAEPFGFFCIPDDGPSVGDEYELFGQGHLSELFPSGTDKTRWASMLGIGETLESDTLLNLLWDTLGVYSDPSGDDLAKPILPTRNGILELHLGGHSRVKARRLTPDRREWAKVVDVVKRDLGRIRVDSLDGKLRNPRTKQVDELMHRRVLKAMVEKYRCGWEELVPNGWGKNEKPERHDTTVTDDFNRADSTSLGADWTEKDNVFSVASNDLSRGAGNTTNGAIAHWSSDLSSDDHYAQIDFVSASAANGWMSGAVRIDTASRTWYDAFARETSSGSFIRKIVSDVATNIASGTNGGAPPYTCKLEVNGSSLTFYKNGVSIETSTDTSITGYLRPGVTAHPNETQQSVGDDFEAADLGGGGTTVTPSPVVASWSIPSPTLRKTRTIVPVSATWSTPAPTLRKSRTVEPVASTWSTPAPTLAKSITPDPVGATWTVNATTLTKSTTPSPVVATWTIMTPGLAKAITPSPVTATWTVTTPTTGNQIVVTPDPVIATWSIPSITATKTVHPQPVSASWQLPAPTLVKTCSVSPVLTTWTTTAPTLIKTTSPSTVSATWTVTALTTSKIVRPSPVSVTWAIADPTTSHDNPAPTLIRFTNEAFANPAFINETFANPSMVSETFTNPRFLNETFTE